MSCSEYVYGLQYGTSGLKSPQVRGTQVLTNPNQMRGLNTLPTFSNVQDDDDGGDDVPEMFDVLQRPFKAC